MTPEINSLHHRAMELASQAVSAQRVGDAGVALSHFREAMETERRAALLLVNEVTSEPSRSVLLRSAASLAIDCGEFREAERLIAIALAGNPPEELCDELRDLYENVTFGRHLELNGTKLGSGEIQLSLAGNAVGYGFISAHEYFPRVQTVEKLIHRTVERRRGLQFRENRKPSAAVTRDFQLFLSVPRAASFAVTLRVGRPVKQMQLFEEDGDVLLELLECVKLFNDQDHGELEHRIENGAYRRNFIQLTKRLAPDGERIRTVGFTAATGAERKTVALQAHASRAWTPKPSAQHKTVVIQGALTEAVKKKIRNVIGVREETGKVQTIHVPVGLMNDIVRPLWDRNVIVTGHESDGKIVLVDIKSVDDENT